VGADSEAEEAPEKSEDAALKTAALRLNLKAIP
jgi:hypothetical protein